MRRQAPPPGCAIAIAMEMQYMQASGVIEKYGWKIMTQNKQFNCNDKNLDCITLLYRNVWDK
jgi:hypothetical protein